MSILTLDTARTAHSDDASTGHGVQDAVTGATSYYAAPAIKTESLVLVPAEGLVRLSVEGRIRPDTFDTLVERLLALGEARDGVRLRLDLHRENFDNLGETREAFRKMAELFRQVPALDRVALVSDSPFIQSSAKVEGAAIPGMTLLTFGADAGEAAERWLRDLPLSEAGKAAAEEASAPVEEAEPKAAATPARDAEASSNPWDNLDLSEVDL